MAITISQITDKNIWNSWVQGNHGHPLQLWEWGEFKSHHNWSVQRLSIELDGERIAVAQLLSRHLPFPFKAIHHLPRGPVVAFDPTDANNRALLDATLQSIADWTKERLGGVYISVEPAWETHDFSDAIELSETIIEERKRDAETKNSGEGFEDKVAGAPYQFVWPRGWQNGDDHAILAPHTLIIDLAPDEDTLLANMRKKTRYAVRTSLKNGITVHRATDMADFDTFMAMYHETSQRAGFAIHADAYYRDLFTMMPKHAPLYGAKDENGQWIAFLWLATSQEIAWELYAAENETGRDRNANYAMKWEVMKDMKAHGVRFYDPNGLINKKLITFKCGFAKGQENWLVGTGNYIFSKPLYWLWNNALPLAQKIRHTIKK